MMKFEIWVVVSIVEVAFTGFRPFGFNGGVRIRKDGLALGEEEEGGFVLPFEEELPVITSLAFWGPFVLLWNNMLEHKPTPGLDLVSA